MKIDLDALEKLALSATPGPWEYDGEKVSAESRYVCVPASNTCVGDADGEFIAAVSPDVVLELIRRARTADATLEEFNPSPDSLVVLRVPADTPMSAVDGLHKVMDANFGGSHRWVVASMECRFEEVDEGAMRALGWVRASDV